ncbi:MAG: hypothetical protein WCG85_20035 [Polyangia bacterium]
MLNKLTKLLLVATSFAPVLLTLWFAKFSEHWDPRQGVGWLEAALILTFLCLGIIGLAQKKLQKLPVQIESISSSDKELVGFIIAYLLPLINKSAFDINDSLLYFVLGLFFLSILTTNSYHFNPVLGFFGFHFYEATLDGNITYILMSKKNLTNTKKIKQVVQISEYMLLEIED